MKCSSITLTQRHDYKRKPPEATPYSNNANYANHNQYNNNLLNRSTTAANLSITNLSLPENVNSFNTGSSLEKWSKKKARLKSGKSNPIESHNKYDDLFFSDYDIIFDVNTLLENLDKEVVDDDNYSMSNMEYELHSDIAELLLKSQRNADGDECELKVKVKKRKKQSGDRKSKKTIKFSLSKPASPETEQVIRVDVTSSVAVDVLEIKPNVSLKKVRNIDDCSKGHGRDIEDAKNAIKFSRTIRYDCVEDDDEFIIRCKQLALSPKELFSVNVNADSC